MLQGGATPMQQPCSVMHCRIGEVATYDCAGGRYINECDGLCISTYKMGMLLCAILAQLNVDTL